MTNMTILEHILQSLYNFQAVGDVDSALILSKGELLESSVELGGEGLILFAVGIIQGENLIGGIILGNKGLASLKSEVVLGVMIGGVGVGGDDLLFASEAI